MSYNSNGRSVWQRWYGGGSAFSFGNALHFNGANSVVTGVVNSVLAGSATACTRFWFKNDTATFGATFRILYGNLNSATSQGWGFGGVPGTKDIRVYLCNGASVYAQYTMPSITVRNHVAIFYNGGLSGNPNRLMMEINGSPVAFNSFFGTVPATIGTSGQPIRFGRFSTAQYYYDGWLDEFCLWSDAVGSDTYNGGLGADPVLTNLIRHCKFNESNPSATTLDETGNDTFALTNFNYDANDGFAPLT